ncbi:MAG TPA: FecR domain-containing protein [Aggregatilineaceae bacterium]|nr:FecR domain-containing protein [Aggregatilineaceae bacterium]
MVKQRAFIIVLILILVACGSEGEDQKKSEPTSGEAVWTQSVATLLVSLGSATVTADGTDQTIEALANPQPVRVGDRVAMAEDGEGVLTFFEGAETRLAPGTVVEVTTLEVSGESTHVDLTMLAGQTLNSVDKVLDANSRHEIITPAASISIRGTDFLVFVRPNNLTQVATTEGKVQVTAGQNQAEVTQGYGVAVQPDQTVGTVNVWAYANPVISSPVDEMPPLAVIFTNTEKKFTFRYRIGDVMPVPLGPYELVVQSPGPARVTGIEFPPETPAETPQDIPVTLGAITLDVSGAEGETLMLTFTQGDLTNTVKATSGDTLLVGLGDWTVEVARESAPEQTQTVEFTAVEDEVIPVAVEFGR